MSIFNFFGASGLIEIMNGVFISNMIMKPIVRVLGRMKWWCRVWRRSRVRKFIETGKGGPFTQGEANEHFKNEEWMISFRYATIYKLFAMCLFYMQVMPYVPLFTVFALIFHFWAEKVKF